MISHHVVPDEKNSRYLNSRWFTERGRGKRFDKSPRVRRRENFPISEFQAAHGTLAWPLVTPDVRHLVTPDVRHLVTPDVGHLVTPDSRHLVTPDARHLVTPDLRHLVTPDVKHLANNYFL